MKTDRQFCHYAFPGYILSNLGGGEKGQLVMGAKTDRFLPVSLPSRRDG
jgi:hypothetical protein